MYVYYSNIVYHLSSYTINDKSKIRPYTYVWYKGRWRLVERIIADGDPKFGQIKFEGLTKLRRILNGVCLFVMHGNEHTPRVLELEQCVGQRNGLPWSEKLKEWPYNKRKIQM